MYQEQSLNNSKLFIININYWKLPQNVIVIHCIHLNNHHDKFIKLSIYDEYFKLWSIVLIF